MPSKFWQIVEGLNNRSRAREQERHRRERSQEESQARVDETYQQVERQRNERMQREMAQRRNDQDPNLPHVGQQAAAKKEYERILKENPEFAAHQDRNIANQVVDPAMMDNVERFAQDYPDLLAQQSIAREWGGEVAVAEEARQQFRDYRLHEGTKSYESTLTGRANEEGVDRDELRSRDRREAEGKRAEIDDARERGFWTPEERLGKRTEEEEEPDEGEGLS